MSLPIDAGTWVADPTHTRIGFVAKHLGLTKVRGNFETNTIEVEVADTLEASSVKVTIDLNSVNTHNADRDAHLKNADFFGTTDTPSMEFVSTSIKGTPESFVLAGDLTINGKTLPIELDAEFSGSIVDPWGNTKAGFEVKGEINRSDFGISFNIPVGDGFVVSEKINIEIEKELAAKA